MSREAYQRAERCFALARSTTFPGERKAAIARGTFIAEKAGLDLDRFDIPGRVREKPEPPERLFEGNGFFGDNFRYAATEYADLQWAQFEEIWRQVDRRLREREAFNQAVDMAAEKARRQRERDKLKFEECLNFLWAKGVRVYRASAEGEEIFTAPEERPHEDLTPPDLIRMARERGWPG